MVALLATAGVVLPGLGEDEDCCAPQPTTTLETTGSVGDPQERAGIEATLAAIESGDLPYEEDGGTFQNREGFLPQEPLGYYREYTVETPGSPDRGARRLVIGEGGETYYTNDHYESFIRIDPKDYSQ